jgi:hypothetical protein
VTDTAVTETPAAPAPTGDEHPRSLRQRLAQHWRHHFEDPRRERLFMSSVGFGTGAVTARAVTHMIHHHIPPFQNVSLGGRHVHHLVFGITGLLASGLTWLIIADAPGNRRRPHRAASFIYGTSAALTLDEFALWLNLEDVYWAKQGKLSVEALMLFGAALSIGAWGGPFLKSAATEALPAAG